jgi:hypothetical protein
MHLTPDQLSALLDGALEARAREEAERHLAGCAPCREALAELATQDQMLQRALDHDPGEAYFESFAARVEDRMRAGGLRGAQQRVASGRGLAEWFRSPKKLAWVAGLAAVIAGAGVVLINSREVGVPDLRDPEIAGRLESSAPAPPPSVSSTSRATDEVRSRADESPATTRPTEMKSPAAAKSAPATTGFRLMGGGKAEPSAVSQAPTPAAESRQLAAPSRVREVKRNALGEDVPVQRENEVRLPQPAAPAPTALGADGGARVRKPQFAEPMRALARDSGTAAKEEGTVEAAPQAAMQKLAQEDARAPVSTATTFEDLPVYPRSIARNAQRLTVVAGRLNAASGFDAAAAEWTRLLGHVLGGPLEGETRWQIASARVRAWQLGASQGRATRALDATNAFLVNAPPGPQRAQATRWVDQLKK